MAAAESHSDPESLVVKLTLHHFRSEERQPNVTEAPGPNLAIERRGEWVEWLGTRRSGSHLHFFSVNW